MKKDSFKRVLLAVTLFASGSYVLLSSELLGTAHDYVAVSDLESLRALKIKESDFTLRFGAKNDTLLLAAARARSNEIVKWILEQKRDREYIEATDSLGNTAFMLAAYYGSDDVAETLLLNGASYERVESDDLKNLCSVNTTIRDIVAADAALSPQESTNGTSGAAKNRTISIPSFKFEVKSIRVNGRKIR